MVKEGVRQGERELGEGGAEPAACSAAFTEWSRQG